MERHESAVALEAFATSNAWCDDYRHEGDLGIQGRETFRAPEGVPEHHVYVCPADSFTLRQHLIFRDYLRSHPDEAKTYGELKMALAGQFVHDREQKCIRQFSAEAGGLERVKRRLQREVAARVR